MERFFGGNCETFSERRQNTREEGGPHRGKNLSARGRAMCKRVVEKFASIERGIGGCRKKRSAERKRETDASGGDVGWERSKESRG